MPSPDLSTNDQRWEIYHLFTHFGIKSAEQMKADAARILKLDYLPDMREMTSADADELIGELRRALAAERVNDE